VPKEEHGKNRVVSLPSAAHDEQVFSRVEKEQAARGAKIQEWKFEKGQVEGFRYRMEDALRAVTASAIKEARIKELKQEILASNKLKVSCLFWTSGIKLSCGQAHFEDHPKDLEYLRHDKPLHPARVQPHMKYVPRYLLPRSTAVPGEDKGGAENIGFVPFKGAARRGHSKRSHGSHGSLKGRKKSDPLKKFGNS
jgi:ATP-dependent RNA helicase DDX56/DBP9